MKLTFHGGVRGVTGSRHLINCNGKNVLLDCGLFQGHRRDTYELNLNFPFDPREVDAVVVSHAHMDHLGNLPNLVKKGFNGEIHCTLPTADLAVLMLYDSAKIQEHDIDYVNARYTALYQRGHPAGDRTPARAWFPSCLRHSPRS